MEKQTKYWLPYIIALIQWLITFIIQIDRIFFEYDQINVRVIVVKVLYLITLVLMWKIIFKVYDEVKNRNVYYIRGLKIFLIYFGILMMLLLILWPGTWSWDDASGIVAEHYYGWNPWQHIVTAIYHEVLLQILPFLGGLIILQNMIIAGIVAYFIINVEKYFDIPILKNKYVDILIKILPFMLPPILMHQFSGYRMGMYIYVELLMLIILVKIIQNKEIKWKLILLFAMLVGIVSTWRTESVFYIPFVLIIILVTDKRYLPFIKKVVCISFILLFFGLITKTQSIMLGNNSYNLISIIRPCTEIVRCADRDADQEALEEISKVFDINIIYEHPENNGEALFWNFDIVKNNYSEDDYNDFLRAFVKLCLKYSQVVIKERLGLFVVASGVTGKEYTNVDYSYSFYDEIANNINADSVKEQKWILNKPLFVNLRKKLIHALGIQIGKHALFLKKIIWNVLIPLMVLIIAWVLTIIEKRWKLWWVLSAILIRVPVVILSQPSGWIMYYLSFYLLGYVILVYGLLKKKGDMCKNG